MDKKELAIPLRDFRDAEEVENKHKKSYFRILIRSKGEQLNEAIIGVVLVEETTISPPPPPIVIGGRKKRNGKGYSIKEIEKANIPLASVKQSKIPYDKRRKSLHSWNVERLKHFRI